ncbi:MAG: hypothetical protein IBX45_06855 [Campylobacterales bacterium]|nr:hypothetical protein [Campylobacterales bacterium]
MKVEQNQLVQSLTPSKQDSDAKSDAFSAELERQLMQAIKGQSPVKKEEDPEVVAFKERLTSLGATAFFQQFNMEKIEKLIEEKREALKESFNVDGLEGKERVEALAKIEEILQEFAKELQERLAAKQELEEKKSPLASLLKD